MNQQDEAERHRAKMAKRKAVQDAEVAGKTIAEGPADRPHRPRQGQIHGRASGSRCACSAAANASAWCSSSRAPGTPASATRWSDSAIRSSWHTHGRRLHLGDAGPRARRRRRRTRLAKGAGADGRSELCALSSSTSSTSRCATTISTSMTSSRRCAARRDGLHVVVTGRNAKPELIAAADLVTEMTLVKHHFAAGVKAQAGIEF